MNPDIQIKDGLLLLRLPTLNDIHNLTKAVQASLTDLDPWMDWASPAYNETSAQSWIEHAQLAWAHSTAYHFSIIHSNSQEYIGNCGIDDINEKTRCCNLWYWIRSSHKGQGFGSQVSRLVADFAIQNAGLIRVEILIAAENLASQRVAQKAGAHYEKSIQNGIVLGMDIYDAVIYSFSPADFVS